MYVLIVLLYEHDHDKSLDLTRYVFYYPLTAEKGPIIRSYSGGTIMEKILTD